MPFFTSRKENPVDSSKRRNRNWFRHILWSPTPREYVEAPEMPKSRPMTDVDIDAGERLVVVELYPGYGHNEHTRQNFGETAREVAGTTLLASYVVGHSVPGTDPVEDEVSLSVDPAKGNETPDVGANAAREEETAGRDDVHGGGSADPEPSGALRAHDASGYRHAHDHAFPAHEAIQATTADSVARTEAAQSDRRSDTTQTALTRPLEADELRRRAKVERRNVKRLSNPIRKQRRAVKRRQELVDQLPRSRRPSRFELAEGLVAMSVTLLLDVPLLMLTLTAVPGSYWEHMLVALAAGAGFAVFAALIGWACARLWEELATERKARVGWAALFGLLLLLLVTVVTLAVFRAEELVRLADGNFHIADPFFFGPLQTLLVATAALAAFRYFLAEEGREAFRRLHEETLKLSALIELRDRFIANAEELLQAAAQAEIDGVAAVVRYVHYPMKEAAEVKSVNSHGKFVSDWFNTVFLRDRFQPRASGDDELIQFVTGFDERRFMLRRLIARALMALAAGTLTVSVIALLLHASVVAGGSLAVALAFGGLGVYVAYLAEAQRDESVMRTFLAPQDGRPVLDTDKSNGTRSHEQAAEAVAAATGSQEVKP